MDRISMLQDFRNLRIDSDVLGLLNGEKDAAYFCTPIGAEIIGWLGVDGIHYCFIPSVDKNMVFVVSPMPCGKSYVEPIAKNFLDFLSLVVICGNSSPLEQISCMNEYDFKNLLETDSETYVEGRAEILNKIQRAFALDTSIDPYHYVKSIQKAFNYTSIPYPDEYYDVTGLDRP